MRRVLVGTCLAAALALVGAGTGGWVRASGPEAVAPGQGEPSAAGADEPAPDDPAPAVGAALARSDQDAPTESVPRETCTTNDCHGEVLDAAYLHGPMHVGACDACHEETSAEDHAFALREQDGRLCSLCHDLDVHAAPYAHGPFGRDTCLPCHDPHGGPVSGLLRGATPEQTCTTCHAELSQDAPYRHGPVAAGECGTCHDHHLSRSPDLLKREGRELCLDCHTDLGDRLAVQPVVHDPVLDDCRVCHGAHAGAGQGLLVTDQVTLCTECHDEVGDAVATASHEHAAVTEGRACVSCHDPHASRRPDLLRLDAGETCLECHEVPAPRAADAEAASGTHRRLHGPVEQGDCGACHLVHGSDHAGILSTSYASEIYVPYGDEAFAMCFECHDRQLVELETTGGATGFRDGDRNLHHVHVNRLEKGRGCSTCHDPHGGVQDHHLMSEVPFGPGGWKLPIGWQPLPEGGTCTTACHEPMTYDRAPAAVPPTPAPSEE